MLWRRKNTQAIFPRIYFRSLDLNWTCRQIETWFRGAPISLWLKELVVIFFKNSQQTSQQLFWLEVVFYGRTWKDGRSVSADKVRIISNLSGFFGMFWNTLEYFGIQGWCWRGDSNPHERKPTAPSRQRVYQFHHFSKPNWICNFAFASKSFL